MRGRTGNRVSRFLSVFEEDRMRRNVLERRNSVGRRSESSWAENVEREEIEMEQDRIVEPRAPPGEGGGSNEFDLGEKFGKIGEKLSGEVKGIIGILDRPDIGLEDV